MITKEEREKDKAICEAATPGPWTHEGGRMVRCQPNGDTVPARTTEDAIFMITARTALPAYIAAAEEMERRIAKVERLRQRAEREAAAHKVAHEFGRCLEALERKAALEQALAFLRGEQ